MNLERVLVGTTIVLLLAGLTIVSCNNTGLSRENATLQTVGATLSNHLWEAESVGSNRRGRGNPRGIPEEQHRFQQIVENQDQLADSCEFILVAISELKRTLDELEADIKEMKFELTVLKVR